MKRLILFLTISLPILHAGAQTTGNTGTISASFSKYGITSGDTTFFSYQDGRGTTLQRFFDRHLRMPQIPGTPYVETGSCNLYFTIDTAGKVTKTWCESVTNKEIEKEVLRVANKLGSVKPTMIKGKPVATNVMAKVIMMQAETKSSQTELYKTVKADILVVWGPAEHKSIALAN